MTYQDSCKRAGFKRFGDSVQEKLAIEFEDFYTEDESEKPRSDLNYRTNSVQSYLQC